MTAAASFSLVGKWWCTLELLTPTSAAISRKLKPLKPAARIRRSAASIMAIAISLMGRSFNYLLIDRLLEPARQGFLTVVLLPYTAGSEFNGSFGDFLSISRPPYPEHIILSIDRH